MAVAWSWTGPVGIDVEEAGPPQDGMDRAEWARREAIFKAGGGEHPIDPIQVPDGYVGMVAGSEVSWRLAGLAARSG